MNTAYNHILIENEDLKKYMISRANNNDYPENLDILPCTSNISQTEAKKEAIFKIFKIKKINNWTEEEDKLLRELVAKYSSKNWKKIAEIFTGKSPIQCSSRYRRIKLGF
jgi:hypothetical protein